MQSFFFNRNASAQCRLRTHCFRRIERADASSPAIASQPHQTRLPIVLTDFQVHNQFATVPCPHGSGRASSSPGYRLRGCRDADARPEQLLSSNSRCSPMPIRAINIFRYRLDGFDKEYVTGRFAPPLRLLQQPACRAPTPSVCRRPGGNGVWEQQRAGAHRCGYLPGTRGASWWAVDDLFRSRLRGLAYGVDPLPALPAPAAVRRCRISKFERRKTEELNHAKLQFFHQRHPRADDAR